MNSMMKTTFLFLWVLAGMSLSVTAQQFEHFKVNMREKGWDISSIVDDTPTFEVDERAYPEWPIKMTSVINDIGRKTLQTLPVDIKKELVKCDILVRFTLNANGDVYNISFWGIQSDIPLTDEQWLKVFDTIRRMKSEIAPLIPSDEPRWNVRWTIPVSKYLREAGN